MHLWYKMLKSLMTPSFPMLTAAALPANSQAGGYEAG